MKKSILLISCLFLSVAAVAQEGVKIGLRFSPIVSFATVTEEDGSDISGLETSSKLGLSYGLMFKYGFTDNYGIYSGIHIVNKGYKSSRTLDSLNVTENVTMTTVEIPLALKGRSSEVGNGIYINGLFGGSVDVRAAYKNEFTGINPVTGMAESGSTKNVKLINPVNLSFLFGAGAEWELDRVGTVNFGIIYHRGLFNINNRSAVANQNTIKQNYVSLDLGYFF